ncbi:MULTISPECIES: gamma-glutamylcyclotransferase family protein [Nocardioides]|uniref:Putative gamma-glutamylcyclotransferase n=1 Tax=Nocardioides vastitatis TaxID=2568655 RepID=A0ABW0ZJC7_9ACTN|nr:gamma-glutamylcyclotransferase family protein [Nocardioides sp.]THJ09207.1 gamma-glutamylcyclotransferase [Nocardioides sp.]
MSSSTSNLAATESGFSGRLGVLSSPPEPLFTYGTLMFPEVLQALLGRVPVSVEASVEGWRAVAIPDVSYPALVPGPGVARGRVLLDLRREDWPILDAYENTIYDLRPLDVTPTEHRAVAYVCPTSDGLTDVDWDRERFAAEELADFAPRCARWRELAFP